MDDKMKYNSPEYWTQLIQLMLFNRIRHYLDENGMTQKEFAEKLGVSKGYVSQLMNGDFDHKLSKLSELALACGMVPKIEFVPIEFAKQVVEDSYFRPVDWNPYESYSAEITVAYPKRVIGGPLVFKTCKPVVSQVSDLRCFQSFHSDDNKNIA